MGNTEQLILTSAKADDLLAWLAEQGRAPAYRALRSSWLDIGDGIVAINPHQDHDFAALIEEMKQKMQARSALWLPAAPAPVDAPTEHIPMDNPPAEIFLQWHGSAEHAGPVHPGDVSWCLHRVFDSDVRYVCDVGQSAPASAKEQAEPTNEQLEILRNMADSTLLRLPTRAALRALLAAYDRATAAPTNELMEMLSRVPVVYVSDAIQVKRCMGDTEHWEVYNKNARVWMDANEGWTIDCTYACAFTFLQAVAGAEAAQLRERIEQLETALRSIRTLTAYQPPLAFDALSFGAANEKIRVTAIAALATGEEG